MTRTTFSRDPFGTFMQNSRDIIFLFFLTLKTWAFSYGVLWPEREKLKLIYYVPRDSRESMGVISAFQTFSKLGTSVSFVFVSLSYLTANTSAPFQKFPFSCIPCFISRCIPCCSNHYSCCSCCCCCFCHFPPFFPVESPAYSPAAPADAVAAVVDCCCCCCNCLFVLKNNCWGRLKEIDLFVRFWLSRIQLLDSPRWLSFFSFYLVFVLQKK